ncbi:hypothetical protein [Jiella pelagia]|uniref:Uncharacterized protein n=1 Tax=Jiella pelagia TaxID=2986949 RepID=A0ABY7C4Q1_9HYPH|nr:hypothetical protein [Jiella pelagia]WAP70914.1 hypothetical protein OH818_13635 [Jiella pelagia]
MEVWLSRSSGIRSLGVVVDLLEQEGHRPMPVVAGMDEEQAIGLALRIVRRRPPVEQRLNRGGRALREVTRHRLRQKLRPGLALGGRDDARIGVAAGIHEAQRREAVEPGVGDLFDDLRLAVLADRAFQLSHRLGMFASRRRGRIEDEAELGRDLIHQRIAGGLREFLQLARIHQTITFRPAPISASRVRFISWR